MAYLDNTGLAYFWGKIKAWANSVFALIGHKHPSSDVNAMTGYSMPASTGAISSGDTLNQAIGKLEKAVTDADLSNVVHITGTETITGSKHFTNRNIQIRSTARIIGEAYSSDVPTAERYDTLAFTDKNGTWCAAAELSFRESGLADFKIFCADPTNPSLSDFAYIYIGYDENGERYATATSTSSTRSNGNDILTRNWIPRDSRIVHTTGNETIDGNKTFTNGITFTDRTGTETVNALYGKMATNDYFRIQAGGTAVNAGYLEIATADDGNEPIYVRQYNGVFNTIGRELVLLDGNGQTHFPGSVRLKNNAVTKGTPPANNTWWNLFFSDANNAEMGGVQYGYMANGDSYIRIGAARYNTTDYSGIYIGFDESTGDSYARAPSTKSTRSDGTDIITRDWIPQDTRIVHTTGNETISGVKTFNSRIEIDAPYLDTIHFNYSDALLVPSTIPTNTVYRGYSIRDGAGRTLVDCYHRINTSGHAKVWQMHNLSATDATAQFAFTYNNSTNKFYLSGPAQFDADDDSDKIPNTAWIRDATGDFACNAATATKLAAARTIRTNLASTSTASFDGSANVTPGVTGTLPVVNGGTGLTSLDTFVRTTGDQTINGAKTFSTGTTVASNSPAYVIKDMNGDWAGTGPYAAFIAKDKNDAEYARIDFTTHDNSGGGLIRLRCRKPNSTTFAEVSLNLTSENCWFMPTDNYLYLGGGSNRWKQLYASSTTISTSDEREKRDIAPIPDEVLDAWSSVEFAQFRFNDAFAEKGESARTHSGLVAQRIQHAFASLGLDASKYGLFCYDEWDAEEPQYNEKGELERQGREAGNRYALRYEEALCMEAACMRRENARLKKRVADLEERLAALELKIS